MQELRAECRIWLRQNGDLVVDESMPQVAPLTDGCLFERGHAPQLCGAIVSLLCCMLRKRLAAGLQLPTGQLRKWPLAAAQLVVQS